MFVKPLNLDRARILLTNDDGIHADGLRVLEEVVRDLAAEVWVVAPEVEQSGAGHSLTLHRPLRLRQITERRFAVDGTPTDCMLLAVNHILRDARPDLVLSGINGGANLGEDVTYSGTVAAAMEATLLGVPALALSQAVAEASGPAWPTARAWAAEVIRRTVATVWPVNVMINVNFPACAPDQVTGIKVVRQGSRKIGDDLIERCDPRGRTYFWIGPLRSRTLTTPDTDVVGLAEGAITVTPLDLDLTHDPTIHTLKQAFA